MIHIHLLVKGGSSLSHFEPGTLALPVHRIIWAPDNAAHWDHLHVEGIPKVEGTLDDCNTTWTESIITIVEALNNHFGEGVHHHVWDDTAGWTNMGVHNCRNISGTNTPSQHAFSNAIDIGPYYGQSQQQKFYDFLTQKEDNSMAFSEHEETQLKRLIASLDSVNSSGSFAGIAVELIRKERIMPLHTASADTATDSHARSLAQKALDKLRALKDAI